jgi:hypothetical protein
LGLGHLRVEFLRARSSSHGVLVRRGTAQASYATSFRPPGLGVSGPEKDLAGRIAACGTIAVLDVVEVRLFDTLTDLGRDGSYLNMVGQ